jgi:NDP-sugar pyrophosphorylase family protein
MNIVIPMAGRGTRFKQVGITTPKPLINVLGKPMFYWALDSLKDQVPLNKVIFVCLKEDVEKFPLEEAICSYEKNARIVVIDSVTSGQAETVQLSSHFMKINEPLIIYNCDTYMISSIGKAINNLSSDIHGIISVFKSYDPSLSYVKLNSDTLVDCVVEKKAVSPYATTGLYHFSSASLFLEAIETATETEQKYHNEYFVGPLYNSLIQKGYHFMIDYAKGCVPLGTPQQLNNFYKRLKL